MGLADRYKEVLKNQGIKVNLTTYKPRPNHARLILTLITLALIIPSYIFVYQNYNACSLSAGTSSIAVGNSAIATNPLKLNCGIDTTLYSATIALIITIVMLLMLKAARSMKKI